MKTLAGRSQNVKTVNEVLGYKHLSLDKQHEVIKKRFDCLDSEVVGDERLTYYGIDFFTTRSYWFKVILNSTTNETIAIHLC